MLLSRIALVFTAAVAVVLVATTVGKSDYTFQKVIESDGDFLAFPRGPSLNNAGQVVFLAELNDPNGSNSDFGLYRGDAESVEQVAFSNGLSPYRDVLFADFPVINNNGDVAFYAVSFLQGPGVFTGPDPVTDAVANQVDTPYLGFGGNPVINDAGTVVFQATLPGGVNGLYRGDDPSTDVVVDNSGPFASLSAQVDLNNAGDLLFVATLDNGVSGLYSGPDPVADRIADTDGPFSFFSSPRINDAGDLVFYAQLDSGVTGLYTGPDPATDTIIDDSGPVEVMGGGYINNNGELAFSAVFDGGRVGIFNGTDLENDQIVATGMPLFGSTAVSIGGYDVFNDLGQIAFSYILDNGESGIAIANPLRDGDYNQDGAVDSADYGLWSASYGMTQDPPGIGADGNGDGIVDAADYTVWRDNRPGPPQAVPEPAGLTLLGTLGLVGLFGRPLTPRPPRRRARR